MDFCPWPGPVAQKALNFQTKLLTTPLAATTSLTGRNDPFRLATVFFQSVPTQMGAPLPMGLPPQQAAPAAVLGVSPALKLGLPSILSNEAPPRLDTETGIDLSKSEHQLKTEKLAKADSECTLVVPPFLFVSGQNIAKDFDCLIRSGITHIINTRWENKREAFAQ